MIPWSCPTHGPQGWPLVIGPDPYCPRSGCCGVLTGPRIPERTQPPATAPRETGAAIRETNHAKEETEMTNDETKRLPGATPVVLEQLRGGARTRAEMLDAVRAARPDLGDRARQNLDACLSRLKAQGKIEHDDGAGTWRLTTSSSSGAEESLGDGYVPPPAPKPSRRPATRRPREEAAQVLAPDAADSVAFTLPLGAGMSFSFALPRTLRPEHADLLERIAATLRKVAS